LNVGLLADDLAERWGGDEPPGPPFGEPGFERPGRAGRESPDPERLAARRLEHLKATLDLDESQQAALTAAIAETLPRLLEELAALREARHGVRELYGRTDVEPGRIREAVGELARVQTRLDSLVAESMLRETEILTPEQRARYVESLPWGLGRGGLGGGGRHGGPPPPPEPPPDRPPDEEGP
jgi:Spy/CpxP family protein refolding chaperone